MAIANSHVCLGGLSWPLTKPRHRTWEWHLRHRSYEPGSKLVVLGMAIPPLIGNPYKGYINPYYWVDDHPLLYGNNGSLDPSTLGVFISTTLPNMEPVWVLKTGV